MDLRGTTAFFWYSMKQAMHILEAEGPLFKSERPDQISLGLLAQGTRTQN